MSKVYVFYNPLSGHGKDPLDQEKMRGFFPDDECVFCDMTAPDTYGKTLHEIAEDEKLVICGGDGTLNYFLNLSEDVPVK